jgi:hypothetical protein
MESITALTTCLLIWLSGVCFGMFTCKVFQCMWNTNKNKGDKNDS